MKRKPAIVAGPFEHEVEAYRWGISQTPWRFVNPAMTRRYRRGWYILDRSRDVIHVGSKAWRKRMTAKAWAMRSQEP